MQNNIVVYRSRREQMMDEFWMSEDGCTIGMILVLFLIAALGTAWLYETVKWGRLREAQARRWEKYSGRHQIVKLNRRHYEAP